MPTFPTLAYSFFQVVVVGQALVSFLFIATCTSIGLWVAWGIYLGTRQPEPRHLTYELSLLELSRLLLRPV